ncbi:MAG: hypothetical protein CML36_02055 [Rhodobacteraceae bacterium]|nr:hypothetical protein [Paracoccaceae bacterium]OUU62503.1 MAG: hypothetical protein CBC22_04245 [Alphaproteobacteria bacterium TMED62]
MNNILFLTSLNLLMTIIVILLLLNMNKRNEIDSFSSYYNSDGAFAGFIQKKNNLFRACEFSTNGSILSCSKWFDDDLLQQGQNQGLDQKNI